MKVELITIIIVRFLKNWINNNNNNNNNKILKVELIITIIVRF